MTLAWSGGALIPVIETVLRIFGGNVQEVHPLLAQPFDADIDTKLTGWSRWPQAR